MTYPCIHMNGTSAGELAENYNLALSAIGVAMDMLNKCNPNGRDYYPLPVGSLEQAIAEQTERLNALRKVYLQLEELTIYCYDRRK